MAYLYVKIMDYENNYGKVTEEASYTYLSLFYPTK